jgi:hypothetical protein
MDVDQRLASHRHSEFWFEDGNIVFRVSHTIMNVSQATLKFVLVSGWLLPQASNTLFCVHRGVLVRHSPALEAILAMPSGYDTDGTEQHPIVLHQISEVDFTYFLNWVYHMYVYLYN